MKCVELRLTRYEPPLLMTRIIYLDSCHIEFVSNKKVHICHPFIKKETLANFFQRHRLSFYYSTKDNRLSKGIKILLIV